MNATRSHLRLGGLLAAVAGLLLGGFGTSTASGAPVPVKLNLNTLRCIQNYQPLPKDDDAVYLTVTGVAKGAEINKRLPESGTLVANSKKPPVTDKAPVTLWEGELADGEFALVTVALYVGQGDDAAKKFAGQLADATKGVAERSKKTLTAAEGKSLAAATLKAQRGVVEKVKDTLARDKKTDAYAGLFNVLVWNDGGKIVKRLDPVGLTFGEHFGTAEKVYSKIKYTRNNVLVPEGEGEEAAWYPQVFPPLSEDKLTVRVKMLENEFFKDEAGKNKKNTTDYLADLQLTAGGKPVEWKLGGENTGPSQTHYWWEYAE
jgi:hypothetical protein